MSRKDQRPKTKDQRPKHKKIFERDHGAVEMAAPLGGMGAPHRPVLLEETLKYLAPERGGLFVDCTVGLGGHSEAVLKSSGETRVIGMDLDLAALAYARQTFARSRKSSKRQMSMGPTAFLSTLASLLCSLIHPSVGLVFVSMLR
jgi:hypothetical protein